EEAEAAAAFMVAGAIVLVMAILRPPNAAHALLPFKCGVQARIFGAEHRIAQGITRGGAERPVLGAAAGPTGSVAIAGPALAAAKASPLIAVGHDRDPFRWSSTTALNGQVGVTVPRSGAAGHRQGFQRHDVGRVVGV